MLSGAPEIETKYEVGDPAGLPSLDDLPGVTHVDEPLVLRLEATYVDTPDLALGRRGITLRRRTGGVDAGWHLKLPVVGARHEIGAPLGSGQSVPSSLRKIVQGVVRDRVLVPVATLSTERTVVALRDAGGGVLAEVCDDRVLASRSGVEGGQTQSWREWELEERGATPELVEHLDARLRAAGARPAAYRSKAGRVLGLSATEASAPPQPGKNASERELLLWQLQQVNADVRRLDPLVRADVPDSVHQMRVATRHLRSNLRTFGKCFDAQTTEPFRDELAWLGHLLGRQRDLEVVREHLRERIAAQPPELVLGDVGSWVDLRLRAEAEAAHRAAVEAMGTTRYFALLDTLDDWCASPPWHDGGDRPASKRLPKAVDHVTKALVRSADNAAKVSGPDRTAALHEVRKDAKQVRYAAEGVRPVARAAARRARVAKQIQTVLGRHRDAVAAAEYVRRMAEEPAVAAGGAFTLGAVHAALEAEASSHEQGFRRHWKRKWRKVL